MLIKTEAAVSTESLIALPASAVRETGQSTPAWVETTLAIMFTVTAIVAVSFVAVITGLV